MFEAGIRRKGAMECYDRESVKIKKKKMEFIWMRFIDGCFILHFIDSFLQEKKRQDKDLQGFPGEDLLLMENQLPFIVLDSIPV